jgi:hypothetical protein
VWILPQEGADDRALLSSPQLRAKVPNIGYGVRSDFELNFGRYLPSFGRADEDGTGH